ncbi:PrgI family protein, partial [Dorea formicigenerans]|uniref:PrgI family protein n=1 Tax=Dorea formicigenerans TaxID=39486 RepID=UPI00156E74D0|nr:PrgI family protein [Dorea formicigenerans]
MAYVPVPKDLTKVKTKVMFNLTKRQLICFTGGALIGVPLFFVCAPWARSNGCKSRT